MGHSTDNHFASAAMLIRRPVKEVFDAFIDPAVTTKFWFTKSTGKLETGTFVEWTWEMYGVSALVKVIDIKPPEEIIIEWDEDPATTVHWTFQELGPNKTYVSIKNYGFEGDQEQLISQIRDSTGGFTWVLSGLKALLEHGIELNLIADHFPPELQSK